MFPPAKRLLGQGNVFTRVFHSVQGEGYRSLSKRFLEQRLPWTETLQRDRENPPTPPPPPTHTQKLPSYGKDRAPPTHTSATALGGTHPTGMHLCVRTRLKLRFTKSDSVVPWGRWLFFFFLLNIIRIISPTWAFLVKIPGAYPTKSVNKTQNVSRISLWKIKIPVLGRTQFLFALQLFLIQRCQT